MHAESFSSLANSSFSFSFHELLREIFNEKLPECQRSFATGGWNGLNETEGDGGGKEVETFSFEYFVGLKA